MYEIFVSVIEKGGYNLPDMLHRIRIFAAQGELTADEQKKLEALAREKVNTKDGVDLFKKVEELEQRVRTLEAKHGEADDPTGEAVTEFVVGKWYYAGDKVAFNGKTFECIAPAGVACVWSPTDYPAYWQEV